MDRSGLKIGTCVTFLALLLGLYLRNGDDALQKRLHQVLQGLRHLEEKHVITLQPSVAVGYGICTDVFVEARHLLQGHQPPSVPQHYDEITSYQEFLSSFAYYFRHGAAAEHYIANATFFQELVSRAQSVPSSYTTIGGNAAVMALRFAAEGCQVSLAAKLTKKLRQSMPRAINIVGGEAEIDDVHLILEYKSGESWGPYTSVRANRYIVHNDRNNPMISSLEAFDDVLRDTPDLFIVSGLQMMDNYPFTSDSRRQRLEKVRTQMLSRSPSTKIHFEMASFAEQQLLAELCQMVIPFADSLGMNEQEIVNLHNGLHYGNVSLVSNSTPRIATVLDHMRSLFKLARERSNSIENSRRLSRIHVHTLAYQAIVTVKHSVWKNSRAAAAKASLTAHRHVCGSSQVDLEKAKLIMDESFTTSIAAGTRIPLNAESPVSCWEEVLEQIPVEVCVAPVLVCTQASQTAGGGDNISSAGLVLQI